MEEDIVQIDLLEEVRKIVPEARSCYHHIFGNERDGYIIHGKFSLPITEKFRTKEEALINALDILNGRV